MRKLKIFIIILYSFIIIFAYSENTNSKTIKSSIYYDLNNYNNLNYLNNLKYNNNINYPNFNTTTYNNFKLETSIKFKYFYEIEKYKYERKKENLFRRSEIIFFGSLTFAAFGGWFFLSVFNVLIYEEPFGTLKQEQFVPLIAGSCLISLSIVLTDLFITLRPKIKNIEIY